MVAYQITAVLITTFCQFVHVRVFLSHIAICNFN